MIVDKLFVITLHRRAEDRK